MQIHYDGQYLEKREAFESKHRILVFHRYSYGDKYDNKPYDEILKRIPEAYCDGWTIYLPNDFDRNILTLLIEYFKGYSDITFNNLQQVTYINDEITKATFIYKYVYEYEDEDY